MTTERFKLLSAVHLFLIRDSKVLLLRRFNTGYEDGKYSVIAGHLEGDEEVKAAAIREAREEAGIEISPQDLQVVGAMHRKSDDERIDFFLTATSWSGEITNKEPDRCDQLAWFALDKLPDNVIPYVRRALDNYRRGHWFDSFGWKSVGSQAEGDLTTNSKVILLYLLMLVGHVAHVFEEVWGRFWLMDAFFGLGWFLAINWALFCIPVVLLYFVLHGKRRAYWMSMVYAGIMILNGVGHNVAALLTGRYFGGFAGGFTGLGLVAAGLPLLYYLWKELPAG